MAQQFGRPGQAAAREAYRGTANAGRQELARQGAGKPGQNGAAAKVGAAAAAGAAGKAAAKRAGPGNAGVGQQARPTHRVEHRQAPKPRQTVRPAETGTSPNIAARANSTHRGDKPVHPGSKHRGSTPAPPIHRHVSRGAGTRRAMARGGGRRSDIRLKHDITLLGRLDNGLGFYRFAYNGEERALCRRDGAGSPHGEA